MKGRYFQAALATGLMLSHSSIAMGANPKAQELVQNMTSDQEALLAKFPDLAKIDGVIRADCAAKNKGNLSSGDFCSCAAAVTMSLWRTGADPKMIPRLSDFLKNPTDAAANSFLQYQGPELYRGVCQEAAKH